MNFASVRLVTADVDALVAFYARLTQLEPVRPAPEFAEFRFGGATLAISAEALVRRFNAGAAVAAANRSAMIEFQVADVDAVQARLGAVDTAMPPTDMPWGNRSMLLRDPDGNVINVFSRPAAAAGAR
jgi:catechol 2,3-dioxygenase-like lactoylglutathione lyase family enzyme